MGNPGCELGASERHVKSGQALDQFRHGYANELGTDEVGRDMKQSANEAKQADEKHTQIVAQLLG